MASRGGRGRGGGPMPRNIQVSKKLSWLLRHGAEKEGLKLDANGYVNMADILANRQLKSLKVTFEEIREIVEDNDKQRFALLPDPAVSATEVSPTKPADWLIRANQGHSIKMESDSGLLVPITKANMPEMAVHGTTHANWVLITASGGLRPMTRNHVHFASGLPASFSKRSSDQGASTATTSASTTGEDATVISGMRSSSTILMYLDVPRALDAGLSLGMSANGVILTAGNADGLVPLELFRSVEDRTGQGLLLEDGKIVKEAPASWARKGKAMG